jgi:hypothetical protein
MSIAQRASKQMREQLSGDGSVFSVRSGSSTNIATLLRDVRFAPHKRTWQCADSTSVKR